MKRFAPWFKRFWPRRFLAQLTLLTALTITVGLAAFTLYITTETLEYQHDSMERQLGVMASSLAVGAAPHMLVRDAASAEQLLLQAAEFPGVRGIALINHSYRVLSEVRREPGQKPQTVYYYETLKPPTTTAARFIWRYGARASGHPLAFGLDATALVVWQPIENGELGWLRIETAVDDFQIIARKQIQDSLLFGLALIVLSALALYGLLQARLRALSGATDFARRLTLAMGEQFPIYTGSHELEQLGHALNDTSRRLHQQEIDLVRTSALLRNVLDAASEVSIIATDVDGIITVFNRGAERLLGYRADELVGQHTPAVFHLASEVVARGQELSAVAGATIEGFRVFVHVPEQQGAELREWTYVRKDGSHVPVALVVTTMREPGTGTISGYLGIAEDITERKRIDRMKSEFVSTVSHELRTPLTSITGALGLISGGAVGTIPPAARDMITIAHKNSEHLARLVNDLLDMEKLVAGKMSFDLQTQPLQPLIEQALETNHVYGASRQVRLTLANQIPEAVVRVDSHRLAQVLANLLSNAIKYSPDNDVVEVSIDRAGTNVRVTVTDHGPGIPEEFRPRLFQKFSQADSSDTRQKGGTGLGLAISRELIERMGGRIDFTCEAGRGTRFFFDLPLVAAAEG